MIQLFIGYLKLFLKEQKLSIFLEEFGENGTPHLQGYIECPKKCRYQELHLPDVIHWEKRGKNGTRENNIVYCSKSGFYHCSRVLKPVLCITCLYEWQAKVLEIYNSEPDGRTCHWVVDVEGGKGKSSFCKYMAVKYNVPTIQGGKLADIINVIFNLDMNAIRMVLIDVPRNLKNNVSYSAIECILNGMITNTKYETGLKVFNPPHVVVFSNYYPVMDKLSMDRWKIMEL